MIDGRFGNRHQNTSRIALSIRDVIKIARKMNAVFQDAFLGRDTASLYLTIINHIGLIYDETMPIALHNETVEVIGADGATRELEEQISVLQVRLELKHR